MVVLGRIGPNKKKGDGECKYWLRYGALQNCTDVGWNKAWQRGKCMQHRRRQWRTQATQLWIDDLKIVKESKMATKEVIEFIGMSKQTWAPSLVWKGLVLIMMANVRPNNTKGIKVPGRAIRRGFLWMLLHILGSTWTPTRNMCNMKPNQLKVLRINLSPGFSSD